MRSLGSLNKSGSGRISDHGFIEADGAGRLEP